MKHRRLCLVALGALLTCALTSSILAMPPHPDLSDRIES